MIWNKPPMSIAPLSTSEQCFYTYDRERSCGRVVAYGTPIGQSVKESTSPSPPPEPSESIASSKDTDKIGFGDLLDIINPLQHLPVIGWAYRTITGDTIKPVSAMMGGALFGGGVGLLTSAVQEVLIHHNQTQGPKSTLAQAAGKIDRLISSIIGPDTQIVASAEKSIGLQRDSQVATERYASFNREKTAGSIAVYG